MLRAVRFWTTGAASPLFALLLASLAVEGCSLKSASQDARLSLSLPNPHRVALAQSSLTAGGGGGLAPSAWNAPEFICYGVNVTGPGIADTSSKPDVNPDLAGLIAGTTSCAYRGIVSQGLTFPSGGGEVAIDLQVPPGPDRVIQLIGITNADYCASNFLDKGGATAPGAYEIGRVRSDLYADTTVSIPITYVSSQSKRVDCGGSTATISPVASALGWAEASPRSIVSATATWTVSPNAVTQSFQLYADSTCAVTSGNPIALGPTAAAQAATGLTNGVYAFKVSTTDANSITTDSACSPPMTIDTVVPGPASALAWGATSPTHSLALTASWTRSTSPDLAHQVVHFYSDATCTIAFGAAVSVDPPLGTASVTAAGDGTYAYVVDSFDTAGNIQSSPCSPGMVVDTAPPTVAITSPAAGAYIYSSVVSAFSVGGTCTEYGANVVISGAASATVLCNVGTWGATLDFTSAPEGTVTITATQTDTAGNPSVPATRTFTKDTVAPTVALTSPAANAYANSANFTAFILTGTCSENGQAVSIGGPVPSSGTCTGGTFSIPLNVTSVADGSFTVYVDHSDAAGNPATQVSRVFIKDTVAPSLASVTVTNPSPSFTTTFNLSYGSVTGTYAGYCILVNSSTVGSCAWVASTLPTSFTLGAGDQTGGPKVLTIFLKDSAGNLSGSVQSPSVTYDASCDTLVGNGTSAGNAFVIDTPIRLRHCVPLREAPGVYFQIPSSLTLDLSSVSSAGPIPGFRGILNGQGAVLTNFNQTGPGFFASIVGGQVLNLTFQSPTLTCVAPCGILAGQITDALVQNVQVSGTSTLVSGSSDDVGGLVGKVTGASSYLVGNHVSGLTIQSNEASGVSGGVGGLVGTFLKSAGNTSADFYRNVVDTSRFGTSACGSSAGGLIGRMEVVSPSANILIDQNSVTLDFACGAQVANRIGGAIGLYKNTGYTGAVVTISNLNVHGNISGTAGTDKGGIVGSMIPQSGDVVTVATSYYGGTMNTGSQSNVSGIATLNGAANFSFVDDVWAENGAYFPMASNSGAYGVTMDASGHYPISTIMSTTSPYGSANDWFDPTIWVGLGLGSEPKLAFEP